MEFFYEEQAVSNEREHTPRSHDDKTDEVFHKLEDQVDQQYQKTTDILKKLMDKDDVQLKWPLDPEVSGKAQNVLHKLDSNLQNVEQLASGYWDKVAKKSFWSSMTDSLGSKLDQVVTLASDSIKNPNTSEAKKEVTPVIAAAGNRTEAELKKLSTSESLYLDNEEETVGEFDVDAQTEEISKLLEQDKDLSQLMNRIVPEKIPYESFWKVYFFKKNKILDMESKRKEILKSKKVKLEEDEEFAWDDEDEEDPEKQDEELDTAKPAECEIAKEKNEEKAKTELNTENPKTASESTGDVDDNDEGDEDDDDDDDDDDWE